MAPVQLSLGRGRRSMRGEGNGQRILGPLTFSVPRSVCPTLNPIKLADFNCISVFFPRFIFQSLRACATLLLLLLVLFSQWGVANSAKRILTHILAISAANIRQRGEFAQQNTNKRVKRNCAGLTQKSINCFNLHINNNNSNNT